MLSGLGADRRLFSRLILPDNFNLIHIDWIPPVGNETILSYAKRLSVVIDTGRPFYIVGLSFGGMVASELARILVPIFTVIISSASSAREIPWYYKLAGTLQLPGLLPASILKSPNSFTYWCFGAKTSEERMLLKNVLKDTNTIFLRWALTAITTWRSGSRPNKLFHIHGTSDKILPIRFVDADVEISNGEHILVYSQAKALSNILAKKFC